MSNIRNKRLQPWSQPENQKNSVIEVEEDDDQTTTTTQEAIENDEQIQE